MNFEGIKKYGELPVCLFSQAKFLVNNNNLKNTENFNSLEIIIIKIEDLQDLNSEIDAYEFFDYSKLNVSVKLRPMHQIVSANLLQIVYFQ